MSLFHVTFWLVYLQMRRIWMKWSFYFQAAIAWSNDAICVPRTVLIRSQISVSHWRWQSIPENTTLSTIGLPFLSCSQESHTEAFSFFSNNGWLAWRSHIVSMFECALNSGGEVISSAQQHVWCLLHWNRDWTLTSWLTLACGTILLGFLESLRGGISYNWP